MIASPLRAVVCGLVLFATVCFLPTVEASQSKYRQVEWVELMPAEDLEALLNPPESIYQIVDGSEEDTIDGIADSEDEATQRYLAALESNTVVKEFDNAKIKLPGFIVPIEMKGEFTAVEFLFVPYFGACLHLPPPPPNQIVYVSYPKGVALTSYRDAFWLEGTLKVEKTASELGKAAYTLDVDTVSPYTD